MKRQINPAPLVTKYSDYVAQISALDGFVPEIDIDLIDWGRRTLKTITIDQALQFLPQHSKINFDIQMDKPEYTVEKILSNLEQVNRVIINVEADKGLKTLLKLIKKHKIEVGVSINPENSISDIEQYFEICDYIQIFTIEPGIQGSEFLPERLELSKKLIKSGFKGLIGIDGGVNLQTIELIKKYPINICSVGSFISKAENPIEAYNQLEDLFQS
jgi:pentose-5-phosphate-3-epimerase